MGRDAIIMKMITRMIVLIATAGFAAGLEGAQISLAPSLFTNDYSGSIKMDIAGLNVGESVVVERFIDFNGNGIVDDEDFALQSVCLTDDLAPTVGGVRNPNIPGDEDGGIPRQIRSVINMRLSELDIQSGNFLMRLTSATHSFTPVLQPMSVFPPSAAQVIVGNVMTSGGALVSNSWVMALDPNTGDPVAGVPAGSTNGFLLKMPAGIWNLVALKPGYVSPVPVKVALHSISAVTTNLVLEPGSVEISGVLHEMGTNTGLPAVSLMLRSETGRQSVVYTDANGNFSCSVTPGKWTVTPNLKSLTVLGYVSSSEVWSVDATAGNVTHLEYALPKATALVYGRVKNSINRNIVNLEMMGDSTNALDVALAYTDPYGTFFMGLAEGAWFIAPYEVEMSERGLFGDGQTVTLANDEAQVLNLVFTQGGAHLRGQVVDVSGAAVSGLEVEAWNFGAVTARAYTDIDGAFDIHVTGGRWYVKIVDDGFFLSAMVADAAIAEVAEGGIFGGIQLIAAPVIGHLTGRFVDSSGLAITNLPLVATNGLGMFLFQNPGMDGEFDFAVSSGNWTVQIDSPEALSSGLLSPLLIWAVTNSDGVSNVVCVARQANTTLSINVMGDGQTPIAAIPVFVDAAVNGTNYHQESMTESNGMVTFPVFDGVWNVALPTNAVEQLGCLPVPPHEVIITGGLSGSFTFQLQTQGPAMAPALTALGFQITGFELVITGESRREYRIDGSTNLTDWLEVGRVTMTEATNHFIDSTADLPTRKYYRVVVLK